MPGMAAMPTMTSAVQRFKPSAATSQKANATPATASTLGTQLRMSISSSECARLNIVEGTLTSAIASITPQARNYSGFSPAAFATLSVSSTLARR